eukprot:PLAT11879.1.p1 GENE.PLAT11879.1~~PLAT11879.1.p1  ORF type:complete len:543 (-),score=278.24 PLAT11879.1:314-1942(-)
MMDSTPSEHTVFTPPITSEPDHSKSKALAGTVRVVRNTVLVVLVLGIVLGTVLSGFSSVLWFLGASFMVVNQSLLTFWSSQSTYLLATALKHGKDELKKRVPAEDEWPFVTVQLPLYNERFLVKRLLQACVGLDYPSDRLEIQILDDSTDDTPDIVRDTVKELQPFTPFKLIHVRRDNRHHFKAGALAAATKTARGEFLAIFDADFVPQPSFLRETVPYFYGEERVGCVQSRWGHLNRNHSMFTSIQALGHDGHFMIEQHARSFGGLFLNFNGTAGIWRKSTTMDAGGWCGDSLAEDLDLSYRIQMAGWKIKYTRDVVVPAELPSHISAFKKQQFRWAKGSLQSARRLIPALLASNATFAQKLGGIMHLLGYGCHMLMVLNFIFTMFIFLLGSPLDYGPVAGVIILSLALGPPFVVIFAQCMLGHPGRLLVLPQLLLLHHGIIINNCRAVIEAWVGKASVFERTPKYGDLKTNTAWKTSRYAQLVKVDFLGELVASIALWGVLAYGIIYGNAVPPLIPWLAFFASSFTYIVFLHLQEIRDMA